MASRLGIGEHGWVESSSQCATGVKRNKKWERDGREKIKSSKYYNGIFSWEGNIVSSSGKKETEGAGVLLLRKAESLGKALL